MHHRRKGESLCQRPADQAVHGASPVIEHLEWLVGVAGEVDATHVILLREGVGFRRDVWPLEFSTDEPARALSDTTQALSEILHRGPDNLPHDLVMDQLEL